MKYVWEYCVRGIEYAEIVGLWERNVILIYADYQVISLDDCIKLQKRRRIRLAMKLAESFNEWVEVGNDIELESVEKKLNSRLRILPLLVLF